MAYKKTSDNSDRQDLVKGLRDIRAKLTGMAHYIKDATPPGMAKLLTPERIINIVLSSAGQPNSQLHRCSLPSIAQCVTRAVSMGLEPNGPLGHCYLIPYCTRDGWTCQLIIGYRGFILLARRSGEIQSVEAHAVYEKDFFEVHFGSETRVLHRPNLREERGELFAVYSVAKFVGGGFHCDVMSAHDVRQNTGYIKALKAKQKRGIGGPWIDHFDEMAKKTVLRRACKYYPMSVELAMALQSEDEQQVINVNPSDDGDESIAATSGGRPKDPDGTGLLQLDPPNLKEPKTVNDEEEEPPLEDDPMSAAEAARAHIEAMTASMKGRGQR